MAIDRIAGLDDRIHVAWRENVALVETIRYRNQTVGAPLGMIRDLASGSAPILTVGAGGAVYVTFNTDRICRLNPAYDACLGEIGTVPNAGNFESSLDIPGIPGDPLAHLRVGGNWSPRASLSNPDRLYFAYQAYETDGDGPDEDDLEENDVYLTVATFDPLTLTFSFTAPAPLTITNDDADQFGPAVVLSRDASLPSVENIFVSWYDRRAPTVGCPASPNRCYRVMRSRSFNGGLSFMYTQSIPVAPGDPLSDPALLPSRCNPDVRFHGDYHESRGELLHSRHVVVGAPLGSPQGTSTLTSGWVSGGYWYW